MIVKVIKQLPTRSFQGENGMVTVVEVLVTDGANKWVMQMNEKDSYALAANPLTPDSWLGVTLGYTVSEGREGALFQKVKALKYGKI